MTDTAIPDIVGTVRGYRTWNLIGDRLYSPVYTAYGWRDGLNTATCNRRYPYYYPHDIPEMDCGCGFYSYYSPRPALSAHGTVYGVIESQGGIVLAELAMRTARAQIVALCLDKEDKPGRHVIEQHYPSIKVYASKRKMHKDFPPAKEIAGVEIPWRRRHRPATFVIFGVASIAAVIYAITFLVVFLEHVIH
jgi:hypothetical protein